jgi:hypothetical protein
MTNAMKTQFLSLYCFCFFGVLTLVAQPKSDFIITSDIDNFWIAFDSVHTTTDTFQQLQILNRLYFDKGSAGLPLIMQARRYTPQEYLSVIHQFPLFWASIRPNTLRAKGLAHEIEQGVEKLKLIYPALKPTALYFTMGALRSPGTSLNKTLLIGAELAMADSMTNTSEFTTRFTNLKPYFATNPSKEVVFLNIHEYVHTQQNVEGGYDLLSQCLFEGIAEFIPTIALQRPSPTPAIAYGKANNTQVRAVFEREMFSPWIYNWVWNSAENQFQIRDLGYYIGYAIAERFYNAAKDKKLAIQQLIELDFTDSDKVEAFIDKTGYLSRSVKKLKKDFEKSRPTVMGIKEFKNGSKIVPSKTQNITISFSEPMDTRFRSTDFGKLGKAFFPEMVGAKFADDGRSITYEVQLKPNQKYQFVVERSFRNLRAIPLKDVVEFSTGQ